MKELITGFYGTFLRLINIKNLPDKIFTEFTARSIYKLSIDTQFKDTPIIKFSVNLYPCYQYDDNHLKIFKFFINTDPNIKFDIDLEERFNLSLDDINNIHNDYKNEDEVFLTLKYGKNINFISKGYTYNQEESLVAFTNLMNNAINSIDEEFLKPEPYDE